MEDCFLDLEVDVNGEEVFVVNKVKILGFLDSPFSVSVSGKTAASIFRFLFEFLSFLLNDVFWVFY